MNTMTKTQSVSATKLAVATAVLLAAGGLAMATLPGQQGEKSSGPISGSNLVAVTSCEQKGTDIEVSRNNSPKFMMKAGCKNTGNGFLNYTYQCVSGGVASSTPGSTTSTSSTASSTQGTVTGAAYKVYWAPCSNITITADSDTYAATGGTVTVGANKLLAVFDFAAYAKEASIIGLVLTKTGTIKNENLTNIKLTNADGSLLSSSHFSPVNPDKLVFTFNKVIPTDAMAATKLMVSADILNVTPGGDTLSLGINSVSDVRTTSFIGVNLPVTYGPVKVMGEAAAIPTLNVVWEADTSSGSAWPSPGQTVGKLKFSNFNNAGQDAKISSLIINGLSTFSVSDWKLYADSELYSPLAEGQVTMLEAGSFKVTFSNFEKMIGAGNDKTFFITANTTEAVQEYSTLSITVKSVSDIGSSVAVKDIFPLSWKTLIY